MLVIIDYKIYGKGELIYFLLKIMKNNLVCVYIEVVSWGNFKNKVFFCDYIFI